MWRTIVASTVRINTYRDPINTLYIVVVRPNMHTPAWRQLVHDYGLALSDRLTNRRSVYLEGWSRKVGLSHTLLRRSPGQLGDAIKACSNPSSCTENIDRILLTNFQFFIKTTIIIFRAFWTMSFDIQELIVLNRWLLLLVADGFQGLTCIPSFLSTFLSDNPAEQSFARKPRGILYVRIWWWYSFYFSTLTSKFTFAKACIPEHNVVSFLFLISLPFVFKVLRSFFNASSPLDLLSWVSPLYSSGSLKETIPYVSISLKLHTDNPKCMHFILIWMLRLPKHPSRVSWHSRTS